METLWRKISSLLIAFILSSNCYSQTMNEIKPTVSMKEYVDMQIEMTQKITQLQVDNINENVIRANLAMEKRLDAINEFRGQLKDQAGTFITRDALWGWALAIVGLILAYLNYVNRKSANNNSGTKNIQSGDSVKVEK